MLLQLKTKQILQHICCPGPNILLPADPGNTLVDRNMPGNIKQGSTAQDGHAQTELGQAQGQEHGR